MFPKISSWHHKTILSLVEQKWSCAQHLANPSVDLFEAFKYRCLEITNGYRYLISVWQIDYPFFEFQGNGPDHS